MANFLLKEDGDYLLLETGDKLILDEVLTVGTNHLTLGQIEKNFLIRKVGANAPLNELKKRFFTSQGATGFSINDLEVIWLAIAIVAAGGTPVGNHSPDLWKQLNAVNGFKVSNYKNENKMTYYLNAL